MAKKVIKKKTAKKTAKQVKSICDIEVHCSYSEVMPIEEVTPNPRNPNKHPDEQIALLAKIIRHQGWRNPVAVSSRSGFVVKGHGRLQAARLLQLGSIPVDVQYYKNEAAEYSDMIADNRIAELSHIDNKALKGLLVELGEAEADLSLTGFVEDELAKMIEEPDAGEENFNLFEQSVQMEPAKEFLVVICTPEEYEGAKDLLKLKQVRRGGYKEGSAFDSVGWERCINYERLKNAIRNTK
jgi:hypothetical protein